MSTENLIQGIKDWLVTYGPGILAAIITLLVGLRIIKILVRMLSRGLQRSKIEVSLQKFFTSLLSIILKVLLVITVVGMLGVQTTSFIAILGAAGLAVGLALQGSLANFAGGVLILLFKPYEVNDFIDAQGVSGTVRDIQVFNTVLTTPDNKTVIIPNGSISNGIITNFSTQATRRVDMKFGIGYSDDIAKTKATLLDLIQVDERILADPEPMVVVSELADSSVNFVVRVWCQSSDYWGIYFDMQEKVKLAFDANDISIPFPQRDIHLHSRNNVNVVT